MTNTEKILEFWKMLEANQFVKSTNSITDQVEEYPPAIQDMEATVRINGEFDKYAIDEWLSSSITQAIAEERAKLLGEIRKRRDSLSMSTKFAVMMMNQRGDAGKMVKELRELGGYQAIDELLSSLDKPLPDK